MAFLNTINRKNIILLFLGGLICSPFDLTLFLGAPLSVKEIILLFLAFLLRKDIYISNIDVKNVIGFFILLLFLSAYTCLMGIFPFYYTLSAFRSFFYLFFFVVCFSRYNSIQYVDLFYVSLGSVIANTLSCYLKFSSLDFSGGEQMVLHSNYFCFAFLLTYIFKVNKYAFSIFILSLLTYLSIYSGVRKVSLFFLTIIVAIFFYDLLLFKFKKRKKTYSVLLFLIMSFVSAYSALLIFFKENYYTIYVRIFYKYDDLLNNTISSQDEARFNFFTRLVDELEYNIIPHGFVAKNASIGSKYGVYTDFPLFELLHTFGTLVTIVLICIYFFYWVRINKLLFLKKIDINNLPLAIIPVIAFIMLVVDGSLFYNTGWILVWGWSIGKTRYILKHIR